MGTETIVVELFEDWSPKQAELVKTDMEQNGYPAVDVKATAQEAVEKLGMEDPQGPGYLIPLFTEDAPEPSNEYVVYRPERGQFIWYDTETGHGTQRFTSCSKFQNHEIGHRLRFWISMAKLGLDDSELPAESIHPTDRLSETDQAQFFDDLENFIQTERMTQRKTNWQSIRSWPRRSDSPTKRFGPVHVFNHWLEFDGGPVVHIPDLVGRRRRDQSSRRRVSLRRKQVYRRYGR